MSFIYNNKNESSRQDNPQFLPGMNCAMWPEMYFNFDQVDVSQLTDLSNFFYGCSNLHTTPLIDVTGKSGLDTMLQGCERLVMLNVTKKVNQDITFYTTDTQRLSNAFGLSLLNDSLELNDPSTSKVLRLPAVMYQALTNEKYSQRPDGSFYPYDGGDYVTIFDYLPQCGWDIEQF